MRVTKCDFMSRLCVYVWHTTLTVAFVYVNMKMGECVRIIREVLVVVSSRVRIAGLYNDVNVIFPLFSFYCISAESNANTTGRQHFE